MIQYYNLKVKLAKIMKYLKIRQNINKYNFLKKYYKIKKIL